MRMRLVWWRWRHLCMLLTLAALASALIILAFMALMTSHIPKATHKRASETVDTVYFQRHEDREHRPHNIMPSVMDTIEAGNKRMTLRRQILSEACAALLPQQHLSPAEFLISEHPSLVYCPVYRAASASWLANMLIFKGAKLPGGCGRTSLKPSTPPTALVRRLYPAPSLSQLTRILATAPSLIIVRHPLDRLLSAFRDADMPDVPDFPSFAQHLMEEHAKGLPILDERWTPISNFCTPCAADFAYIAKVETLAADQKYLLLVEPALKDAGASAQWCHPNRRGLPTTPELSSRYYSTLPAQLVRNLSTIYAEDMRLFGYSLRNYLAE